MMDREARLPPSATQAATAPQLACTCWCTSRAGSSSTGAPRSRTWVSSMPTPYLSPTICGDGGGGGMMQ